MRPFHHIESGLYIFLFDPPPWGPWGRGGGAKIWQNNRLGKKGLKVGEMHIFPLLVKSMHMFSPIDLKYTKLQKKADNFSPGEEI